MPSKFGSNHLDWSFASSIDRFVDGVEGRVKEGVVACVYYVRRDGDAIKKVNATRLSVVVNIALKPIHRGDETVIKIGNGGGFHRSGVIERCG